jgi:hypothetical protein
VNSPAELPDSPKPEFHLAQLDPPNPFKSAWKTVLVAAILITAAIAVFVWIVKKPPPAAGEIVQVNYYPVHSTVSNAGVEGMQGTPESYDQLLVLAKVRVRNQTDIPLFLQEISAVVTLPDGTPQTSIAAGARDFDRMFQAFPSLASFRAEPFNRTATLAPGQSAEGLAIFSFSLSQQQWDARRDGNISITFLRQRNLLIPFPH